MSKTRAYIASTDAQKGIDASLGLRSGSEDIKKVVVPDIQKHLEQTPSVLDVTGKQQSVSWRQLVLFQPAAASSALGISLVTLSSWTISTATTEIKDGGKAPHCHTWHYPAIRLNVQLTDVPTSAHVNGVIELMREGRAISTAELAIETARVVKDAFDKSGRRIQLKNVKTACVEHLGLDIWSPEVHIVD